MWEAGGSCLRKHKGWLEGKGYKGERDEALGLELAELFIQGGVQQAAAAIQVQESMGL